MNCVDVFFYGSIFGELGLGAAKLIPPKRPSSKGGGWGVAILAVV